ncbi:acetate--CoA ligase family protein [Pontibacter cellulosilyticus]|uniref:Acetate--CoA ligase family protein n=1 Tax=Pontibacter cellulosilyticus TaxID=1720253 RepID=A0A923NAV8_9BACT|nr:acetate--CoA ligase [Pontibacter cellulosilyticus]MBC5994844.1 acetate--CoA ligase family protein [Pontibacter cellulosilyticus]
MLVPQLLNPKSIAVIGASNDTCKPGGKVLQNLLAHQYQGQLYAVNPREQQVQGVACYPSCEFLPDVDLAIIAVAANYVESALQTLAFQKSCKAFIVFSAGFSETCADGKALEARCAQIVNSVGGTLIGPNCIGVITAAYKGVFAGPIPAYNSMDCDCVSASGATMAYLLEAAIPRGLKFRDIFSVGNSAQVGVEEVLQYWDETFDPQHSSRIKLLYMEQIKEPQRFLKHAASLVNKGCRIAAIKAGNTEAGSRAVSSHTGALAGSDAAVSSLFRKAGVIRCYSRIELVYVAAIFSIQPLKGNRIAVITHAGGPGVMLTDILVKGGMQVPQLTGAKAEALLSKLHPGSSVANPIDFLATGNATQLGQILDAVENDFEEIDGSVVVFGTTGMWRVDDVYMVLHEKMKTCSKPIFPILPSAIQAAEELSRFHAMGHINFTDEVSFGYVLSRVNKLQPPYTCPTLPEVNTAKVRQVIQQAQEGYLPPDKVFDLLNAAGINTVKQHTATTLEEALDHASAIGYPLVMKVSGPVHKSDLGGVVVGIKYRTELEKTFGRLMQLEGADGVILQQQLSGTEVYLGAKAEDGYGHQVLCGLGGIFVEVFKDVSAALAPVGSEEARKMIRRLKSYPIIKGTRGKAGINEELLVEAIMKLSTLLEAAPEISEMDINPLMGTPGALVAVDARISVCKPERSIIDAPVQSIFVNPKSAAILSSQTA